MRTWSFTAGLSVVVDVVVNIDVVVNVDVVFNVDVVVDVAVNVVGTIVVEQIGGCVKWTDNPTTVPPITNPATRKSNQKK